MIDLNDSWPACIGASVRGTAAFGGELVSEVLRRLMRCAASYSMYDGLRHVSRTALQVAVLPTRDAVQDSQLEHSCLRMMPLTVSQICNLICFPSMLIILAPNSTPIVRSCTGWNRLSVNCNSKHDLPTPVQDVTDCERWSMQNMHAGHHQQ